MQDVIELQKVDPGLRKVRVAIGWTAPEKAGSYDLDLDACLFLLDRQGRVRFDQDFIFYNNPASEDGHAVHSGDNRDGLGEGDDEVIDVALTELSYDVEKLVFTISVHNAQERFQSFKDVQSGFIRVINAETAQEIARFELTAGDDAAIAYEFASMTRNEDGGWSFERLQKPHDEGLFGIARDHGVNVAEP